MKVTDRKIYKRGFLWEMMKYGVDIKGEYKNLESLRKLCLGKEIMILENRIMNDAQTIFRLKLETEGVLDTIRFAGILTELDYSLEGNIQKVK